MEIQCWNVGVMIDTIVFFDGVLVDESIYLDARV